MLTTSGQSATVTCTAEANPEPSFKIFFNETTLVKSDNTYTIPEVNNSHVGYYKCVAENILEQRSSSPICLCLEGKIDSFEPPRKATDSFQVKYRRMKVLCSNSGVLLLHRFKILGEGGKS